MKKPAMVISAAAVALLVVAVALVVRPGSDPVAAQQSSPVAAVAAGPAVARLGNQQVSPDELQALLATVPPETREQLRGNREALERWIRTRLAEKAVLEQADAQGWAQRPEVARQTRAATEQIVFRDYLRSVSQVPADYPSAAELQQAYDAGKANWQTPALYRVSQIFLGVSDPQNLESVRKQALDLSKKLRRRQRNLLHWRLNIRRIASPLSVAAIAACNRCSNWCLRCVVQWRGSRLARFPIPSRAQPGST